jgi:transcription-repair coupling factor (superfamily II helicase)
VSEEVDGQRPHALRPTAIVDAQVAEIVARAGRGESVDCPEVSRGARSLVLRFLAEATRAPIVVLVADEARAAEISREYAFLAGATGRVVAPLPAYDVSPYESVSPSARLVHRRLDTLHRLLSDPARTLVVASAEALGHRLVPRAVLAASRLDLAVGDELDRDALARTLVTWGYTSAGLTEDVGDFSVRGSLVDLFPPTATHPVRIDLLGDTIDQMRTFHPENQRTREVVPRMTVLPCREIFLSEETADRFAVALKDLADAFSLPKHARDALVADVRAGSYFPGIEFLLPLFHGGADTLADYLPPETIVVLDEWADVLKRAEEFERKVRERHDRCLELKKLAVPPEARYVPAEELSARLTAFPRVFLGPGDPLATPEPARVPVRTEGLGDLREKILGQEVSARMLAPVAERLSAWSRDLGGKGIVVCSGRSGLERMRALLSDYALRLETVEETPFPEVLATTLHATATVTLIEGDLHRGFAWPDLALLVLTEEDVFGEKKRRIDRARVRPSQVLSTFGDLQADDFVVHARHGIGIYRGLVPLTIADVPGEFLLLEYAGGDRLYLPVDRLGLVQRFSGGDGAAPTLDRLGSGQWEKTTARAKAGARKMAKELLALYAARRARPGFAFPEPDALFREFEETFPYEETPDQAAAIQDVLADMQAGRPMDRLICGDVGFGKTEVALRAAYLAVAGGKQVAVLVPTTTLAFQHLRTFRARLDAFGVRTAMLSRFVDDARRAKTIEELAAGRVDVLIGTHQLLGKRVAFADLGLLVVDEEQHFGVAQKEKIKQWKSQIDVLTMTATPIPRTFHMSLSGLRDLSIINTPPEDRLSVRTFVTRFDPDTIREALRREFARGGQAFFIHNRVRTIDAVAAKLRRLVPEAKLVVGHGQMDKERLETIMVDFAEQRINLLVSTAIIESGLDFPLANTILIDRADAFGLAQLYQLRGRVGRSERRAYAYLLVPPEATITSDARKRLAVLKNFTELGSGFKIAAHDLEIRGAGNLLGVQQWGHIHEVGFELYQRLLEEAIAEAKGEPIEPRFEPEINLRVVAFIPSEYVPDEHVRLGFYKRLAEVESAAGAKALIDEMADRFGEIPPPLANLFRVVEVRQAAAALFIKNVELGATGLVLAFDERTPVTPSRIVRLVAEGKGRFSLSPDGRLVVALSAGDRADPLASVKKLLHALR